MRKQASPGPEEQEAYDEALRRVEKCRQKGKDGTKLDLNFLGLTTLPEALWKLTALRLLDLQNNQLTTLPEALGQLTALQCFSFMATRHSASLMRYWAQCCAIATCFIHTRRRGTSLITISPKRMDPASAE